jgi:hypothetical protein
MNDSNLIFKKQAIDPKVLKELRTNDDFIEAFGKYVKGEDYNYHTVKINWLYGKTPAILNDINNLNFIKSYFGYDNLDKILVYLDEIK